jgi:hypothetical protein
VSGRSASRPQLRGSLARRERRARAASARDAPGGDARGSPAAPCSTAVQHRGPRRVGTSGGGGDEGLRIRLGRLALRPCRGAPGGPRRPSRTFACAADVSENPVDHRTLGNEGDDPHLRAARRTAEWIDHKCEHQHEGNARSHPHDIRGSLCDWRRGHGDLECAVHGTNCGGANDTEGCADARDACVRIRRPRSKPAAPVPPKHATAPNRSQQSLRSLPVGLRSPRPAVTGIRPGRRGHEIQEAAREPTRRSRAGDLWPPLLLGIRVARVRFVDIVAHLDAAPPPDLVNGHVPHERAENGVPTARSNSPH